MGAIRDKFQKDVAETLTDWRLGCIPPRPDWSREHELFRSGVAEIMELRLRLAYMPLFQGLEQIKARIGVLIDLREDQYAPPSRRRDLIKTRG